MNFRGIGKRFGTLNGCQYDEIGAFWDMMVQRYGRENLHGLGWNWHDDSFEYAIGRISSDKSVIFEGMREYCIELPDDGWQRWEGMTEHLDELYELIYRDGPLEYEIEQFYDDGRCVVTVWRG